MSNCVGSSGLGLPASAVAQHSVQHGDHLTHDGDKDDLGLLAGSGEAVEGFEGGGVTAGAEGRHVEGVLDRDGSAVDASMSPELAAVEVVWRETDEGGDLFAAHATELRQQGDEGESEHGADPWHRGQARVTPREIGLGGDRLGEALLEEADIGLDPRQAGLARRRSMASSSCAAWLSIATCSSQSWRRMVTISAILAAAGSWRTTISPNRLRHSPRPRGALPKNDGLDARLIAEYAAPIPTPRPLHGAPQPLPLHPPPQNIPQPPRRRRQEA